MFMINQEVILIQMKEDFNIGVIPYLPFLYIIFVGCQFAGRFGQRAKQLHYEMQRMVRLALSRAGQDYHG